jgi:hypothetical protein
MEGFKVERSNHRFDDSDRIGLFDMLFHICVHRGNAAVVGRFYVLESLRYWASLCPLWVLAGRGGGEVG